MRHSVAVFAAAGIAIAMATGCAKSPAATESADIRAGFVACAEPRPEACTMQYDPVCGEMTDGRSKTYSNACVACSDRLVTAYLKGACATVGKPAADRWGSCGTRSAGQQDYRDETTRPLGETVAHAVGSFVRSMFGGTGLVYRKARDVGG